MQQDVLPCTIQQHDSCPIPQENSGEHYFPLFYILPFYMPLFFQYYALNDLSNAISLAYPSSSLGVSK